MRLNLAYILSAILVSGPVFSAPLFENRTAGIEHQYVGGWEHFVGGGVATFDCNNDRFPDLYVAGGAEPAKLLINQTQAVSSEVLFKDSTPSELAIKGVTGAYLIDINSDNIVDLVVLRVGENKVFKGIGNCQFTAFNELGIESGDRWTTAFSATWEQDQKLPTLAFGNYVDRANPDGPFGACDTNLLFRPTDIGYAKPIVLEPGYCALSMLFSDWGRKGQPDLRVSNDRHYYLNDGQEQLWALDELPRLYTSEEGWTTYKLWGMGIASRDISGDGFPEIYLTSMGDQKLHSLSGGAKTPTYKDAAFEKGITTHKPYVGDDGRPSTGWQVAFGDVQNDGLDDIFVAKGNVDQMISSAMSDPNSLLIQQADGTFVEFGDKAQVADTERSRGAALVDFNLDGKLDLVVVNRRANMQIYENVTKETGDWVSISLAQNDLNVNAVGAWIEIKHGAKTIAREITIGGGHASGSLGPEHFGLGAAKSVEMRIIWPDGIVSSWATIGTNQYLEARRSGAELVVTPY